MVLQIKFKDYYKIPIRANYDNNSPLSLPMYFVCYDIKNAALNNLDISIYDWKKAYEISSDEKFTMHMPIDMNGKDVFKNVTLFTR